MSPSKSRNELIPTNRRLITERLPGALLRFTAVYASGPTPCASKNSASSVQIEMEQPA